MRLTSFNLTSSDVSGKGIWFNLANKAWHIIRMSYSTTKLLLINISNKLTQRSLHASDGSLKMFNSGCFK